MDTVVERLYPKDPRETVTLSWDFLPDIGEEAMIVGQPIVTIEVDNSLRRNADPDPDPMLNGLPQVEASSSIVLQSISEGIDGVDYKVTCQVSDNSIPPRILLKTSILPVRRQ